MFDSIFGSMFGDNVAIQGASVILGLIVLLFGRKLFWLVLGLAGFVAGLTLTLQFLGGEQAGWLALLIAVLAGLLGAALAIFLQQVAIAVGGFLLGGYALVWVLSLFQPGLEQWLWLLTFLIGGVIGASLLLIIFEVGLILLTSFVGAAMVVQALPLAGWVEVVLFVILLVIGFVVQSSMADRERAAPPPASS